MSQIRNLVVINILFFLFNSCFSRFVIMISPRLRTVSAISLCVLGVLTILNSVIVLETANSAKKGKVNSFLILDEFQSTELFNHISS